MKDDFQRFVECIKTDEALQKKLEEEAKNYDGEMTEEAVFEEILVPVAKGAGFSFTMDDAQRSLQELSLEEMDQVVGGGGLGAGVCAFSCKKIGTGIGVGLGDGAGAFCLIVGFGGGEITCLTAGYSRSEDELQTGGGGKKKKTTRT